MNDVGPLRGGRPRSGAVEARAVPRSARSRVLAIAWRAVKLAPALVAALGLVLLGIGPHVAGYRTLTMRTGSMVPAIHPGDVVVIRPEPVSALRPGQMVTFAAPVPGAPVYTHRVIEVERHGPDVVMHTKGDANPAADPWSAQPDGPDVWYVAFVVPWLGRVLAALNHPLVRAASVYVLPVWLCLEVLLRMWGPSLMRRRPGTLSPPVAVRLPQVRTDEPG